MEGYTVKFKRVDTGKYWIAGNIKEGKYGLQAGMKKTPEFQAYLDSVPAGGWINLSIDKPYEKKEPSSAASKSVVDDLDDDLGF